MDLKQPVGISVWYMTRRIYRQLSLDTEKTILELTHEAALLLQAHYAANPEATPAEVPQRRSTDAGKSQRTDYPTAA